MPAVIRSVTGSATDVSLSVGIFIQLTDQLTLGGRWDQRLDIYIPPAPGQRLRMNTQPTNALPGNPELD